jgi:hypothetical protein
MNQLSLFDARSPAPSPADPHIHAADIPRVTGQNAAILERLRQGPASSFELYTLARRYSARIHDLRRAGYRIAGERVAGGEGEYRFWLED